MIRTPVMDASHHEIGHVDDVVLDLRTGAVRYFAIAYPVENGRTKLFAVPRERFRLVHHDEGGFYFVVDIDKSVFTRAPGFLPGEWPNFANRRWLDEVDVFYGVYVKPGDVKTRFGTSPDPVRAIEHLVRVSRIEGLPVIDDDSEYRIGEVADVIVDLSRGSVRYGVVRFDHPSEDLDRRFAIPWRLLDYEIEDGRVCLELEVAQRELHQAPTFDAARWPDLLNPQFSQELDRFYSRIDD